MKKLLLLPLLSVLVFNLNAQGTLEDYQRASEIDQLYNSKVFYSDVRPVWIEETPYCWYRQKTPDGINYILVDAKNSKRRILFRQNKLSGQLSALTGKEIKPETLLLGNLEVSSSLNEVTFEYDGYKWIYNISGKTPELKKDAEITKHQQWYWGNKYNESESRDIPSPDGKYIAFLKNNNLYVKAVSGNKEKQLSNDGSPGEFYSNQIVWSPDSKKIALMKIRPAEQRYIIFVEAAPEDQLQPKVHKRMYAKPGDALPYKYPHIFDVESGRCIQPANDLFKEPYDNHRLTWNDDNSAITFEYNQRGHQVYRVLEVNAGTGAVRALVDESQPTFVNYNRYFRHDLKDGKRMIWMSERDNWNHLYMYDRNTGKVDHQITKGEWYVRDVISVDEDQQEILFSANGMTLNDQEDPYFVRYYKIKFDGTGLTSLTPEEGMHTAVFSADKTYFVDTYSKVDVPPVVVLKRTADGKILLHLETADISHLKEAGWIAPEPFTAKGRDGKTDIWGVIVRPSNFDPSKKYPVLEYIYAGPGSHYAPKSFYPTLRFMNSAAELGFIVVMLDGMGTSFRSKKFEDVICKNLKDAGFPDRIAWINAVAKKYPYVDADRVGLYGGSAGGQNAMAGVLFHPEFYKAAYAGCGCHDNRMDKIWWNEQWMGYPIGEHYSENSNVDNAWRLTRPLMLMVGEVDDNVDPASTIQVVKALQKAGKEFELVVAPSTNHVLGGVYGDRKRYDFFVKNLLGVTPPDWNVVKLKVEN